MTISQVLLEPYDIEIAMTRRLLERVPADHTDFKPHEKSMPLGQLATHVATLPGLGLLILTTPSCDVTNTRFPDQTFVSPEKLLTDFDSLSAQVRSALSASTDDDLAQPWKFSVGDFVFSETSRSCTFSHTFMNHLVHHRAQLGVYLRLLNLPVPGVYGPSADDKAARQP
jgi:uncharacterized damage-inducible protein DinB